MLDLIALPCIVLGLLVATVGGVRYAHHVRYQRCLANIARLEIELGYQSPSQPVTFRDGAEAWTVSERWKDGILTASADYKRAPARNDAAAIKANRAFLVNAYKRTR